MFASFQVSLALKRRSAQKANALPRPLGEVSPAGDGEGMKRPFVCMSFSFPLSQLSQRGRFGSTQAFTQLLPPTLGEVAREGRRGFCGEASFPPFTRQRIK